MNTLKISVRSNDDADLLIRLLKSLNFVIDVEPVIEQRKNKNQYKNIEILLEKLADKKLFPQIPDPVQWQNDLRNEWS